MIGISSLWHPIEKVVWVWSGFIVKEPGAIDISSNQYAGLNLLCLFSIINTPNGFGMGGIIEELYMFSQQLLTST